MPAEWTPDLTLNHELLDEQHVDLFRKLADAAAALDASQAAFAEAVAALGEALVVHLAAEERLMDDSLYPERVRHKSAHEMFMADFLKTRAELEERGATVAVADAILRRIPEWLRFHIRVNDIPFGAYLARRRQAQLGDARVKRNDRGNRLS